jgi:nicotinate phosphoribosyltransferase
VDDASVALVTDLYEFTMAAAYFEDGMAGIPAVFEVSVRSLPPQRNFLVAAGVEDALSSLESFRFPPAAIDYLASLERFDGTFLQALAGFRFGGEVRAVREGTVLFAQEPLLQVSGGLLESQIAETLLLTTAGFQTLIASKAARVRIAAGDRSVADFGARRAHGPDAALKAARAAFAGGADATSLVLAGRTYGIPVTGTMAHSYVLGHPSEYDAFVAFGRAFPADTVLLIDTFDTVEGARAAARAARTLAAEDIEVRGVRLDSGDLGDLARRVREILDDAGFPDIRILASGGLDEHSVAALRDAPIDGFGVGTQLTTSGDAPALDIVYKLVEQDGAPKMKTSTGKLTLPGRKQVYRRLDGGRLAGDTIALADETGIPGEPLLETAMEGGRPLRSPEPLDTIRGRTLAGIAALPEGLRHLDRRGTLPVRRSARLDGLVVELGGPPQDRPGSDPRTGDEPLD